MRKGFGEEVRKVVVSTAILQSNGTIQYLLTNKMILDLNMLCASMKDWIVSNCKTTLIVTQYK